MTSHHPLRSLGVAATLLASASLSAQSAPTPARPSTSATVELDRFEVSSSKIDGLNNKSLFRTDEEAPLPFNVIDRGEIDRLGATSMEELFRNVPEATNYGNILQSAIGNVQVSGGQTYSTASVNLGGFGAPPTLVWAGFELLAGANPAVTYYLFAGAMARTLDRLATPAQKARYFPQMIDRRWGTAMVLTEPDAGSDVGAARTRAIHVGGDEWRIEGVKRFITNADYDATENVVHILLARPEGAAVGTKGLSMFIVPKFWVEEDGSVGARNGWQVTRLEKKMGIPEDAELVHRQMIRSEQQRREFDREVSRMEDNAKAKTEKAEKRNRILINRSR